MKRFFNVTLVLFLLLNSMILPNRVLGEEDEGVLEEEITESFVEEETSFEDEQAEETVVIEEELVEEETTEGPVQDEAAEDIDDQEKYDIETDEETETLEEIDLTESEIDHKDRPVFDDERAVSLVQSIHVDFLNEVALNEATYDEKLALADKCNSDYGYQDIVNNIGSTSMKALYEDIDQVARAFFCSDVNLSADVNYLTVDLDLSLSEDEIIQTFTLYRHDHPLYYWFNGSFLISDDFIGLVCSDDFLSAASREEMYQHILDKIDVYEEYCEGAQTRFTYATALVYGLAQQIDYAYDSSKEPITEDWAHSIVGVFDDEYHEAVCEGYAKAYQMLLNYFDIPNIYVVGSASGNTGVEGEAVLHAWNMILMEDGKYYWADPTWSDIDLRYNLFGELITDAPEILDRNKRSFDYPYRVKYTYHLKGDSFYEYHAPLSQENIGSLYLYQLPDSSKEDYDAGIKGYPQLEDPGLEGYGKPCDEYYPINGENISFHVVRNDGVHREVEIIFSGRNSETLTIPSQITFNGTDYKVAGVDLGLIEQGLKTLYISEGVRYIKGTTSYEGLDLEEIYIPSTIEYMNLPRIADVNSDCLKDIFVDENNPYIKDIDGVLFSKDGKILFRYPPLKENDVYHIPEGTEYIYEVAFSNIQKTSSIEFPETTSRFGDQAFMYAKSIEHMGIPSSIEEVPNNVFMSSNIKSIYVNKKTKFSYLSFNGITGLESIEIEEGSPYGYVYDGALYIHDNGKEILCAYPQARVADTVSIKDGTYIDAYPFENVSGVREVIIPANVTVYPSAFFHTGIESLKVDEGNTSITYENGAIFNYEGDSLITYLGGCKNETYAIPDKVKTVYEFAFYGNPYLKEITMNDNVEHILAYAFDECTSLETIRLSNNVRWEKDNWIRMYPDGIGLFERCRSLDHIEIPEGVTYLPYNLFIECFALRYIVIPATIEEFGDGNINKWNKTDEFSLTDIFFYGSKEQWESICPNDDSEEFGITVHYDYDGSDIEEYFDLDWQIDENGKLTVGKNGEMPNYASEEKQPWYERKDEIVSLAVEEGVTSLGDCAFKGLTNLKQVSLPSTLESIGYRSFADCSSLVAIELPDSLGKIQNEAFFGSGIRSIAIPDTVIELGDGVFTNCESLVSVEIRSDITKLPDFIFAGCISLKEVQLQDTLTMIGNGSFHSCRCIEYLDIPNGIETIGFSAFYECIKLRSIVLPDSLNEIGDYAFYFNAAIERIITNNDVVSENDERINGLVLPDKQISLGKHVFDKCFAKIAILPEGIKEFPDGTFMNHRLTYVRIPESVEIIGEECFAHYDGDGYAGSLKQIVLSENVKRIGYNAFGDLTQLVVVSGSKAWQWAQENELIYQTADHGRQTWAWNDDYSGAKLLLYDTQDDSLLGEYNASLNKTVKTEFGKEVYVFTATVEIDGVEYQDIKVLNTGLEGSFYVTYTWNGYESVTAQAFSDDDGTLIDIETTDVIIEITAEASCEEAGEYKYIATFINPIFERQEKIENIDPLGHDYVITYEWSEDLSNVEGNAICSRDTSHVISETVETTLEVNDPGCLEDGYIEYKAVFESDIFETQIKKQIVEATGHEWNEPVWMWSENYDSAVALFICKKDENHTVEKDGQITVETIDSTFDNEGSITYTAKAEFEGKEYSDVVVIVVPSFLDDLGDISEEDRIEKGIETKEDIPVSLWTSKPKDLIFDPSVKSYTQTLRVYDHNVLLKEGTDYGIKYSNNSKAGVASYVITGKGNYTGTLSGTFRIEALDLSILDDDVIIVLNKDTFVYNGKVLKPTVSSVVYEDVKLKSGSDYKVSCEDSVEVGFYKITVEFCGNYNGILERSYSIIEDSEELHSLSSAAVSGIKALTYTGEALVQTSMQVKDGKTLLEEGVHYETLYRNNIYAGTAYIVIRGINTYEGSISKSFKINGLPIKKASVTGIVDKTYTGTSIRQDDMSISYVLNGETIKLIEGKDYVLSYKNDIKAGTATVSIKGIGGFSGTSDKTFKINKVTIDSSMFDFNTAYEYEKGGNKPLPVSELVYNTDYTLTYKNNSKLTVNNKDVKASVIVKGKGNYQGSYTAEFSIVARDISDVKIISADKAYVNKVNSFASAPVLTDTNGKKLVAGTDYEKTISYTYKKDTEITDGSDKSRPRTIREAGTPILKSDILDPGSIVVVTVMGKGNYNGETKCEYRIVEKSLAKASTSVKAQYYTGNPITLKESDIVVKIGKEALEPVKDYVIEGYQNNIAKGTAKVTIRGVGKYGGIKTISFKIVQKSMGITIRFNTMGATSGSMKDQLIYKDTALKASTLKKVVDGRVFTFKGWSTTPGGTVDYVDKALYPYDENIAGLVIHLFAVWE